MVIFSKAEPHVNKTYHTSHQWVRFLFHYIVNQITVIGMQTGLVEGLFKVTVGIKKLSFLADFSKKPQTDNKFIQKKETEHRDFVYSWFRAS
jgi:hypothetical protein